MTACKYWDCGWCYAPNYLKTNSINSACVDPYKCPISPLSEPVQYETPMTEIEKVKAQIKVLEKKLSLLKDLKELEKTKSPVEEAFKRVYSYYPEGCETSVWIAFQKGYEQAQKDYKVGEYQETTQEPEELKTLYDVLRELDKPMFTDDVCSAVKKWMSQYTHNEMSGEYASGYEDCMLVLEENLK